MRIAPRQLGGIIFAATLVVAACFGDSPRNKTIGNATFARRDSTRVLGPGDIQIASVDTSVEIALIGDTIYTGFGKKVLDEIAKSTDTTAVKGGGFGASIEKMVKSTVANALSNQLLFAVSDIQDVQFSDGHLTFINKSGAKVKMFSSTGNNGDRVSELFSQSDADRFIAAFKARKGAGG